MTCTRRPGTTWPRAVCACTRTRPPMLPLPWTDAAFTFNTSCYSCHVSQLKVNYDPAIGRLSLHLVGAGNQLRNLPWPRGRARRNLQEGPERQAQRYRHLQNIGLHYRAAKRHVRALPRQDESHQYRILCGTALLRQLRLSHARRSGLLPRWPGSRRELHLHQLADEPLPERGKVRLHSLPHLERPLPLCHRESRTAPASPATRTRLRISRLTLITSRKARRGSASRAICRRPVSPT